MAQTKVYSPITQRFRDAYFKKVPRIMRRALKDEFCEYFKCTEDTFHHKLSGSNRTTTTDVESKWLEDADPTAIYEKRNEAVSV